MGNVTDSDKTSQPRLEKKSLSIDAFDELRSIAFATQKSDKVVTLEDKRKPHRRTGRLIGRTCPICQIKFDPTRAHQICCTPACSNVSRVRLCRARKRCGGGDDVPARHSGRPRSTTWSGKLGAFVNDYTAARLAGELDAELSQIYKWARGSNPQLPQAIAIVEIARAAGTNLSLEDIYERHPSRIPSRPPRFSLLQAIAIVEIARSAGHTLALDDLYERAEIPWRDRLPSIHKAIAIVDVARTAGTNLSLEDIYEKEFSRIRYRIRNSLPPL